jgi:signal transduction histidine kinase
LPAGESAALVEAAPTRLAAASRPTSIESAQRAIIPMDTSAADALEPAQADVAQATARPTIPDEFTASIAYELNQSLAIIVTKGEMCLRWLRSEKPQIEQASAGLAIMIENALCLGDIVRRASALPTEAGIEKAEFDLQQAIAEIVRPA